ncbi:hypothetical protein GPECTOR_24g266 [Gonium pectorale]|uniref:EF-hand domain-containing protein n=1 Tax=Gonium pectorale TaxID=33097 RepID=A0A150GGN1_GONPE|nr:hypothetical protein GPECTOR_24g266 [Gonium pectorale]|eukprot:KXZ48976.1 hypothetical protein GPECTOR_24g266 [Gonium pectorale]
MSEPGDNDRPSATAGQVKEIDRDGSGTIDVNELLNLVEGVVKGRRERRYMWFVIVSLIVLGAILIGTIIGLTYAVVSALKDTELTGNVMVVKDTNEVVRTGSAEFSVVDGVMVSRGALNATTSASGTAASGSAPPPNALIATASYLGSPVKFSSRVDIRTLMELKYLYIKGVGDTELGVMVTGVARVAQPGSVYGTVVHIISAAGTITLDGTAITFDSEVADIFLKSGFTVARNRRALLGVYEVLGFFNLIKDLTVLNLPESQPKPSLPAGDFLMKIKVYEPCIIPDTPNGDRCIYQKPDAPATTGEEFGSSTEPMGNAPLSPPESDGSRRSLLPRRRHLHVKTAPHRALADGGDFGEDIAGVEIMGGQRYMTHNETSILFKGAMKIIYDYALYPGYQKIELVQAGDKTVFTWQQEILGEGSPNVPVPYYCRNSTMPQLPGNGQAVTTDRILSFTYEGVDQMPNEMLARHFKLVIKQRDGSSNITVDYWDSLTDQIPVAFKFEHPKIGVGRIEVLEFKTLNAASSEVARASDWAQPAEEACKVSKFVPKVTSPFAVRGEVVSENDWWGYSDDTTATSARRLARQVPQLPEEEARRRLAVWQSLDHVNGTGEWPQWALDAYGGVHPAQSLVHSGRALQQTDCTKKTFSIKVPAGPCEIEVNIINSQYLAGSLSCSGNIVPIVITGTITGNMCEKTIKGCISVGVGLKKGNWLVDKLGFDSIDIFQMCAGYDAEVGIFYLEATLTIWLFLAKAEISASIK